MTRDGIIRMAHEAGLHIATDVNWMPIVSIEYAKKFAELIAAAEREACVDAVSHALYGQNGCGKAIDAIRERGQG